MADRRDRPDADRGGASRASRPGRAAGGGDARRRGRRRSRRRRTRARDRPSERAAAACGRIGIIGAGENVRDVMIPAFRRIPECELAAVANTSLGVEASASRRSSASRSRIHTGKPTRWTTRTSTPFRIGTLARHAPHADAGDRSEQGKHVVLPGTHGQQRAGSARDAGRRRSGIRTWCASWCRRRGADRVDDLLRQAPRRRLRRATVLSVEIERVGRRLRRHRRRAWTGARARKFSGLNVMNLGAT